MILKHSGKENVHMLNNAYTKEQYAKLYHEQRQLVFRRRRLTLLFTIAVILFVSAGVALFKDQMHLRELKTYAQATKEKDQVTKKEKAALEKEVAQLKDEDYVGKLARSRYFYTKDGELVYVLPETSDSND